MASFIKGVITFLACALSVITAVYFSEYVSRYLFHGGHSSAWGFEIMLVIISAPIGAIGAFIFVYYRNDTLDYRHRLVLSIFLATIAGAIATIVLYLGVMIAGHLR